MSKTLNLNRASPESVAEAGGDIRGLQALARAAIVADAPVSQDAAVRRGPFRPEVWLNARQKHASRLAAHYFRMADVSAVLAVAIGCAWMAGGGDLLDHRLATLLPFVVGPAIALGLLRSLDLYRFDKDHSVIRHLGLVAGLVGLAALPALGLALMAGASDVLVWTGAASLLTLAVLGGLHGVWSSIVSRWRGQGVLTPNVVVVGATRHAEALIEGALERRDINILGVFDDRLARSPKSVGGVPVLGDAEALLNHHMTPYVDRIVLAIDPDAKARVRELTARLATLPNEVALLVDPQGVQERNAALEKLARAPLASVNGPVDPDRRAFNKRLQDLAIGSAALVALSPIIALCALAVKLDSPGPAFFRQRRHGFNQEAIVVWKFRSMRQETADATASRQVTSDDDRITRVGRFLRSTSLDELPQLINVLKGEMSLVGPRPHAIGMKTGEVESALLVAEYAHRHRIKPGMTGWAAIHGSRGPLHEAQDVRRRVQLDIDYIERQSVWLDLWIMVATLPVLLGDRLAVR